MDLDIGPANDDPAAVGEEPGRSCPSHDRAPRVQEPVMSFGDGADRRPGSSPPRCQRRPRTIGANAPPKRT